MLKYQHTQWSTRYQNDAMQECAIRLSFVSKKSILRARMQDAWHANLQPAAGASHQLITPFSNTPLVTLDASIVGSKPLFAASLTANFIFLSGQPRLCLGFARAHVAWRRAAERMARGPALGVERGTRAANVFDVAAHCCRRFLARAPCVWYVSLGAEGNCWRVGELLYCYYAFRSPAHLRCLELM